MNVIEILESKQLLIRSNAEVSFSTDELNTLCDPNQLRALKMFISFPKEYNSCLHVDDCIDLIKQGDSLYRTLEYCMMKNRALLSIKEVFPAFE